MKFWKILGFAALAAGLTPYKVEKNEETGENNYQALLWKGTTRTDSDGKHIDINLNEGSLTTKVKSAVEKQKETHLFTDELSVEYSAGDVADKVAEAAGDAAAEVEKIAEQVADAAEDKVEELSDKAEEIVDKVENAVEDTTENAGE